MAPTGRILLAICLATSATALLPSAAATPVVCPEGADAVLSVLYLIEHDGVVTTTPDLETSWDLGLLHEGDKLAVNFTLAPGCEDREFSLVSYKAPNATFSPEDAHLQVLYDSDTGSFDAGGLRQLGFIDVPPCFFQVDFVSGPVIENLSADNLYGDRKVGFENGGTEACREPIPCPGGLEATANPDGSVTLTWDAVADVEGYNVYRKAGDNPAILLDSTTNTTYTDNTTANGVTYKYRVTAFDGDKESLRCEVATVTTVPFFGSAVLGVLALVGAVGCYTVLRRKA